MEESKMTKRWPYIVVAMLCCAWPITSDGAGGWYLLIPPRSEFNERAEYLKGYRILDTKPLSQWAQEGAYDSASECEAVRNNLLKVEQRVHVKDSENYIKAVGSGTDPVVLKTQRLISETSSANEWAFRASRCIRSDDPRLRDDLRGPKGK
jgi:hypothetical protein